MNDVINFFSSISIQLWSLIVAHWILSISVLITVIGYVIDLVNSTRNSR